MLQAAKNEYIKLERSLTDTEVKGWVWFSISVCILNLIVQKKNRLKSNFFLGNHWWKCTRSLMSQGLIIKLKFSAGHIWIKSVVEGMLEAWWNSDQKNFTQQDYKFSKFSIGVLHLSIKQVASFYHPPSKTCLRLVTAIYITHGSLEILCQTYSQCR